MALLVVSPASLLYFPYTFMSGLLQYQEHLSIVYQLGMVVVRNTVFPIRSRKEIIIPSSKQVFIVQFGSTCRHLLRFRL